MTQNISKQMRRLCVYSFHDPKGIVDDYVIYFLKELRPFVDKILFCSNGTLTQQSEIALREIVDEVFVRADTVCLDVLTYHEMLQRIDFDKEGLYDEILLASHANYGPLYSFNELFDEMEHRKCDFWGVLAHKQLEQTPYHIPFNFIALRKRLLGADVFRQYWHDVQYNSPNATSNYEIYFTEHFTKLDFICDTYLDCDKYSSHHPAMLNIDATLDDRNPLLLREIFSKEPWFLEQYPVDLPHALRIIEKTSDYDVSLIWRNIIRSTELRTLNTNAARTRILPDVRLKQGAALPVQRVAICAHIYYTEMLEEIITLVNTMPHSYDFLATTETEEKKKIIQQRLASCKNIANVIIRVEKRNRGRDMSTLFITWRDVVLDDRYDLICRLHTKKTPHVTEGRGNLFKRHMFENILNSQGYTENVLDMFHDNPWIGVAVPSIIQISYGTLGHAWGINKERTCQLATMLGIDVPFDTNTPIGAFGTMYWFRPKALRKLFVYPWQWIDFEAEPRALDGTLGHAQERIITYVAQDAGYSTEQILSSHLAGWNFAMLEYKLQKILALLPNVDFSTQLRTVEHWRNVTSLVELNRGSEFATPPTIKQAIRELIVAFMRSIAHRIPGCTKIARRVLSR